MLTACTAGIHRSAERQELAVHAHANSLSDPQHAHSYNVSVPSSNQANPSGGHAFLDVLNGATTGSSATGITISNANAGSCRGGRATRTSSEPA